MTEPYPPHDDYELGPPESGPGMCEGARDDALESVPRTAQSRGWGPGWPSCPQGQMTVVTAAGSGSACTATWHRWSAGSATGRCAAATGCRSGQCWGFACRAIRGGSGAQPLGAGRRPQLAGQPDGLAPGDRHAAVDAGAVDRARFRLGRRVHRAQGRDALRVRRDAGRAAPDDRRPAGHRPARRARRPGPGAGRALVPAAARALVRDGRRDGAVPRRAGRRGQLPSWSPCSAGWPRTARPLAGTVPTAGLGTAPNRRCARPSGRPA